MRSGVGKKSSLKKSLVLKKALILPQSQLLKSSPFLYLKLLRKLTYRTLQVVIQKHFQALFQALLNFPGFPELSRHLLPLFILKTLILPIFLKRKNFRLKRLKTMMSEFPEPPRPWLKPSELSQPV
ncbi:hypothetical protein DSECCO2_494800 [anaerobic digester metagenome]